MKPIYLDVDNYNSDQQAIVNVINLYIKAGYEGDFSIVPHLKESDDDYAKPTYSKRIITEIKKVDFDNVPNTKNNDTKYVVIEYTQVIFNPTGSRGVKYEDYQLFYFQREEGEWKFVGTADVWEGHI